MNPFLAPAVAKPLAASEATWPDPQHTDPDKSKSASEEAAVVPTTENKIRPSKRRGKADFLGRGWRSRKMTKCIGLVLPVMVPSLAFAINVNNATVEQLQAVRGIGPKTAQVIIDERQRAGPYASFDDLSVRVKGIGPKKAATMQASGLKVEGGAAAKAPAKGAGRK